MKDRLSKTEINKDALQETMEAGVQTVSQVMSIITGAIRDVTTTIGGFATDAFEIREGVRKAKAELADDGQDLRTNGASEPPVIDN